MIFILLSVIIQTVTDVPVSTLIEQIQAHVRYDRPAQALALCTYILYYYPKHLETYSLMAQALAGKGDQDSALDIYRRVLSADPENPSAYAGLARIFEKRRDLEEAVLDLGGSGHRRRA